MGALEDIFAKFGQELPPADVVSGELEEAMDTTHEELRMEGEWLLYSLKYPLSPRITKICTHCGEPFQTNYKAVGNCSNRCVILELKEKFGISWTPAARRNKERWETTVPAGVIPYKALRAMKKLVAQAEADLGKPIEIGVEVEAFVLPSTGPFGPRTLVSASKYMLPDLAEQEQASELPSVSEPLQPYPSHNQEALAQEDSVPEPQEEDLFGGLFSL